ncbi:MlaD family protein [Vibrio sp. WJH972]
MYNQNKTPQINEPNVKNMRSLSPLWLLPLVTLVLTGWLVYQSVQDAGERIQIHFSDAQGLMAGRTPIKYQGLEIGMVREIKLERESDNIYVEADIYPEAEYLLSGSTRFWLVKPTASLSGVSGLDALISGNYIALFPGENDGEAAPTSYKALRSAPLDVGKSDGLNITLKARDLGGINIGSPIIYKRIPIGEVYSYQLDSSEKSVNLQVSINPEFEDIITDKSRFWNVSGIAAKINMAGVDVQFEDLSALINGAIAVDSPDEGDGVTDNAIFRLYDNIDSAGRGILINIILPENHNLNESSSTINYRGIEVGAINRIKFDKKRKSIIATAAIQPAFADLLKENSQFIIEEAELSFHGIKHLSNLITGNSLQLISGEGEPSRHFVAINQESYNQLETNATKIILEGEDTFGINVGSDVKYRGVPVGRLTDISLDHDKVKFELYIQNEYIHLIRSNNKFYVTGRMEADITDRGVKLDMPPIADFVIGAINFISEGDQKVQSTYHLYPDHSSAELAKFNQSGSETYHLFTDKLPSISINSPVLYHNITVGSVSDFGLAENGVDVQIQIEQRYKHLVNDNTVFWNQSGVNINASLAGVDIQTGSLESIVRGGISFDTAPQKGKRQDGKWKLYDSYQHSMRSGVEITLSASESYQLPPGTQIQYQGITVGETTEITPNFNDGSVTINAQIFPQFVEPMTRSGAYYWIQQSSSPVEQVSNLKSLLVKTISVEPGTGKPRHQFQLNTVPQVKGGLTVVLQSEKRNSISVGTAITYRGMKVGKVIDVHLGELADRVIIVANIENKYAYLVRQNTIFWNNSGIDVSVGLSGAEVKTGSLDSILSGGIAFTTPETPQIKPVAENEDVYYLNNTKKKEWDNWKQPIPKP